MRDYGHPIAKGQAITTDAVSEHTLDLGAAGKNLGNAQKQCMHIRVTTKSSDLDSGIWIFIVDSAAEALSDDRAIAMFTSTNCSDAGVIAGTDLTAGTHLVCPIPPCIALQQYLGLHFKPVDQADGSLVVDAWVGPADEANLQ